jgi:hypothetical protein
MDEGICFMTDHKIEGPDRIWATTTKDGYDTIHSTWPPDEWPPQVGPYDYSLKEFVAGAALDEAVKALQWCADTRQYDAGVLADRGQHAGWALAKLNKLT